MENPMLQDTQALAENPRFFKRIAPALALFFLAPLFAEYLIGYLDSTGNFPELFFGLLFFGPLYGGAALLIREVTRRTGRGWLTIMLLAFAFGVFQAGLVDHSLFNTSYGDFEWWEEMLKPTFIPALGISANFTQEFVIGHVIWSIGIPILLIEMLVPQRRTTPWLGNFGLTMTAISYLLMCAIILWDHIETEDFLPSAGQLVGASFVVAALIGGAFFIRRSPEPTSDDPVLGHWRVGLIAFGILNSIIMSDIVISLVTGEEESHFGISWSGTLLYTGLLIFLATLVWRWSRRIGWSDLHMLALAGAALLTRAWIAFLIEPAGDVALSAKLIHNIVFAVGVMVLLYLTARSLSKPEMQPPPALNRSGQLRGESGTI